MRVTRERRPEVPHYSSNPKVQRFYMDNGKFLHDGSLIRFETGALLENGSGGVGYMMPPPADHWERAKIVERYWEMRANIDAEAFYEFKQYLLTGNGWCPRECVDDEDKVKHAEALRDLARASKRKFAAARKATLDSRPEWKTLLEDDDGMEQAAEQKLRARAKRIEL